MLSIKFWNSLSLLKIASELDVLLILSDVLYVLCLLSKPGLIEPAACVSASDSSLRSWSKAYSMIFSLFFFFELICAQTGLKYHVEPAQRELVHDVERGQILYIKVQNVCSNGYGWVFLSKVKAFLRVFVLFESNADVDACLLSLLQNIN